MCSYQLSAVGLKYRFLAEGFRAGVLICHHKQPPLSERISRQHTQSLRNKRRRITWLLTREVRRIGHLTLRLARNVTAEATSYVNSECPTHSAESQPKLVVKKRPKVWPTQRTNSSDETLTYL